MGGINYQKRVVYDIAIPTLGDTPYFLMFCPSQPSLLAHLPANPLRAAVGDDFASGTWG